MLITDTKARLLDGAQRLAFAQLKLTPLGRVDDTFAKQFLVREILALHLEGETNSRRLARGAAGRLREHLQIKQSVERLAESAEGEGNT